MADNKWHLVSTFDRTQTLDEFCKSIRLEIDTNEKYIYRIKDGIEANEQVKKKNWYRITINDDDSNNVGNVDIYNDDDGSWQDSNMSKEINLRNNTAYWMYGKKENSTNVWGVTGNNSDDEWGVTGKNSGEMKWNKILLNIQKIGAYESTNHDFQLTIYGDIRGFRSFNGTFTSKQYIDPFGNAPFFSLFFVGDVPNIDTVILNNNSFQDEFEYAKNDEGKVKVSFPFVSGTDLKEIVSAENDTANDFFTRVFKQMIKYKKESLPQVPLGFDYPQLPPGTWSYSCSKGLPFTIIFNKKGLDHASAGYNINIW